MPEGSVFDWSALYLHDELGVSLTIASFAGAAFSLTMAIMRFAGDFVRDRLGAVLTMRISTVLAAIGMLIAGLSGNATLAMIGFGKVVSRPWVAGGRVEPRRVAAATLAGDHRASDGHRGASFLALLDELLQAPEKLG